ncbi:rifamycin-inactivating phosphotransferase [Agilicoccus flavus]|uniref:rifamycin-inactivating phosphotransferase n=1 Tax=Agilicoccus flavus TaxID=2775968 RepID=UPI001CF6E4EF|nr:rifamycin-inactivating phosphotransferase [Agilicoccus flavus]
MAARDVVGLDEVDETRVGLVGGKAAHLGALTGVEGVRVPAGFVVTTDIFRAVAGASPAVADAVRRLARADPADLDEMRGACARARAAVEDLTLPDDVAAAVAGALAAIGADAAYAVRSSATAEDLPTASFAGQQDSFLGVVGAEAIGRHVVRCWASLFTERAVAYRRRHGIDDAAVAMAVLVQEMVDADAAGVLFTADPVTGRRTVAVVEATVGLGEALVSGIVDPDVFTVHDGAVATRNGAKERALEAAPGGGTRDVALDADRRERPALSDAQVRRLVALGRRIEARFGRPQDIEWCLAGDDLHVVQSRPITTAFPAPEAADDGFHVYVSVGHQQMMTDAMRPLGWSMWQLTAMAPMVQAGGRLFVDVTGRLATPAGRAGLLEVMGKGDPLVRDALETVLARGDVPLRPAAADAPAAAPHGGGPPAEIATDPAIVTALVERSEASVAAARDALAGRTGPDVFDALDDAFAEHARVLADPESLQVIMAGMQATWWLEEHLREWLGDAGAADALTLSAPGNVTSEMGLALLDVADVIRPFPPVVALLESRVDAEDRRFLDELGDLPGGPEARAALEGFLARYGARGAGEIDITRPRWSERPAMLLPVVLDHVRHAAPDEARRRFEDGARQAQRATQDVLWRLRLLPDGEAKARETARMIDRVRTFVGYREYPKFDIVRRYAVYKEALLGEARRLVAAGVLTREDDAFFLTFAELREAVASGRVDPALVQERRAAVAWHATLRPPRVLTSEGEALHGAYRDGAASGAPSGALVGIPASAGTVEGRARVVLDMARADLAPGDILVTTHTDPSWTPLFVAVAGVITEVGGRMTHGAVIAREYGLPAVVGVPDATRLVRDGQRVRVHGGEGYVELLD